MKMLQPKALAAWEGEEGDIARSKIDYWSVFTPADINWKTQVEHKAQLLSGEAQTQFSNAVFLSHFREAFISCLLQITRDRPSNDRGGESTRVELSREREVALCLALADSWHLPLRVPSLNGLKLALVEEMVHLGVPQAIENLSPYMKRLAKMDVLGVAREIAENFVNVTELYNARWALCFDELEIAPITIQKDLFRYLRSTDQRFVFKLAISPSNDASALLNQESAASAGNDFDAIPLWFIDQSEREIFCRRLWEKYVSGTKAATLSPMAILQRSRFQFANEKSAYGRRRYDEASPWSKDFQDLERIDRSFSDYLQQRGVRSSSLENVTREKMNSIVRKIAPLVGFRSAYMQAAKGGIVAEPVRRKLKGPPPDVFSGWDAVCTATEGNPRWFGGIASRLILKWTQSPSGQALTREQQTHELHAAAKKFLAWINAIPVEVTQESMTYVSLHDLITALAKSFEQEVLGKIFKSDPVLSFTVDEGTPPSVQRLVIAALNIGAIVIVDDQDVNFTVTTPVGRVFRLVHLLAPHFNLPMRKGKTRNLSTILSKQLGSLDKYRPVPIKIANGSESEQLGLF
ncbi:hypothetical protein [Comamonas endophytica]|uniref:ORC-CDC6 family AAA ATPase n=1 Tax=Comamonas endophytica TaxID=2949090 RepID=UPI0036729930